MSSIKEIAQIAQASISTASMVLTGKGDKMRISKSTQARVQEVARDLAYKPNIAARCLRSEGENDILIIAILWKE